MAFYYSLTKQNTKNLIESGLVNKEQLNLFKETYLIDGFTYPKMPVLTGFNPGEISFHTWGFVPKSVSDSGHANAFRKQYNTLIVESEHIPNSKMYREALAKNRCLILCSGYFEWHKYKDKKYPHFISMKNDDLFAVAGIWEEWTDRDTKELNRAHSIITTKANSLIAKINNQKKRMPLILDFEQAIEWLDPSLDEKDIKKLLKPIDAKKLKAHTIGKFSPSNKDFNVPEVTDYVEYPELKEVE